MSDINEAKEKPELRSAALLTQIANQQEEIDRLNAEFEEHRKNFKIQVNGMCEKLDIIDRLNKRIEELKGQLDEYGCHKVKCAIHYDQDCDCGLEQALK